MGNSRWRRLTEERASRAKSVFQFDVQGSVAKSTHAGIPWLRHIRQRLAEELTLTAADGEQLVVWHVAPPSDSPVILYFQGNGGALRHRADRFAELVQNGFGIVAVSYRGFGGSTGSPSEKGFC